MARVLADGGFEIVAQAGDAFELKHAVDEWKPDVAIIDVRMPPTHTDEGARAAKEIRKTHPAVGVLVLSDETHVHNIFGRAPPAADDGRASPSPGGARLPSGRLGTPGGQVDAVPPAFVSRYETLAQVTQTFPTAARLLPLSPQITKRQPVSSEFGPSWST